MDHDVGLGSDPLAQQVLHGHDLLVGLGQAQIAGQDQMQVHVDSRPDLNARSGGCRSRRMAIVTQQGANVFEQRRIGFVHEPGHGRRTRSTPVQAILSPTRQAIRPSSHSQPVTATSPNPISHPAEV